MTPPVLQLRGAGRIYPGPPQVTALQPGNLSIGHGEHVAVVGPSGSGKSTLLNLLGLLDRPTDGAYLIDGIDTARLGERDRNALRAAKIGFVFQSFHLLRHRSAVDNVMLGLLYQGIRRSTRRARATELLTMVGLAARADADAGQLSGGEQQRVAIARALAARPSLLLCDEPTGNLDSRSTEIVLELIDDVHRSGQTVVVVTHDMTVAARAQRLVTIHDGQLADAGRPR